MLVHTLLQKKIEATVRGEIHFGIGGKRVRFGRLEYALVSGMTYEDGPTKAEQDERKNDGLITDHLNGVAGSKLSALITAFTICRSPDDAFKLGLLVFVYGYLLGQPANKAIEERWQKFLYIVQDLPFFFKMPRGYKLGRDVFQPLGEPKALSRDIAEEVKGKAGRGSERGQVHIDG